MDNDIIIDPSLISTELNTEPIIEIPKIRHNSESPKGPKGRLEIIRRRMYEPTSKKDIKFMLNDKVTVIPYSDLENYNRLEDLLNPYQSVVILYPNSDSDNDIGHWCCLFTNVGSERLEFFDSYGCYIDNKLEDFNQEDDDVMHKRHKIEPKLLELILDSKYADHVHYNETPYQSETKATNTCGLWSVMRLKNKHLNEYEFKKIYFDLPVQAGILPDLIISQLICNLFPEMSVCN